MIRKDVVTRELNLLTQMIKRILFVKSAERPNDVFNRIRRKREMTEQIPELERLGKVKEKSQEIGNFLESLSTQGLIICQRHKHNKGCKDEVGDNMCGYNGEEDVPVMIATEQLLADYFNINLKKVEEEKRKILEDIRQ